MAHMQKNKNDKILALVPAHNEGKYIEQTIISLINQTHSNTDVLVISDNSTDNTVEIAKKLMLTYSNLNVIETIENKFKKAGALNTAYRIVGEQLSEYGYVLTMDADTLLESDVIEQALIEFSLDDKLGVVCSRAGVIKQKTNNFMEKYLYHCQYVEYADFDRDRIGQDKGIKVAHGMCSVYNVKAIQDIITKRQDIGDGDYCVYKETNITEDYELTVTIKELGYHSTTGFGIYAWTYVPLTISSLWKQRIRWFRGGIDTLWDHGWNKITIRDIFDHIFFWVLFISQFILVVWTFQEIHSGTYHLNKVVFVILGSMYINNLYTLRYVQDPQIWDYLIRITYIPQVLYTWFTSIQQIYSYYLFLFKPNQEW
jgi:biofilm PGA synthesis N-glycosyltransferase PgaC